MFPAQSVVAEIILNTDTWQSGKFLIDSSHCPTWKISWNFLFRQWTLRTAGTNIRYGYKPQLGW